MKKFLLYGVIAIGALFTILIIVAPKNEIIERSVIIKKPVEQVFPYFLSLKNMEDWSPWAEKDPSAMHEYLGSDGVGAVHMWVSDHEEVGIGEQEITGVTVNKEIISILRFKQPYESTSKGFFKFDSVSNGTKVTWGFEAEYGIVESVFMMFMDMEGAIGKDFEQGLSKAKSILEY